MLKQRVVTALLLAISVFAGIFYLPPLAFAAFISLVVLLAAWEWSRLAGWQTLNAQLFYVTTMALLGLGMPLLYPPFIDILLIIALFWWLLALYWVIRIQQGRRLPWLAWRSLKSVLGFAVLLPAGYGFYRLLTFPPQTEQLEGRLLLVFFLLLIWAADISAFFVGRRWGKRKLAANISPGKSWEGVLGALAAAAVLGFAFSLWHFQHWTLQLVWVLLSILTVAISVLGDLLESVFKRQMDMKDSSHLLPGHGGILDRIDSLTAATPFFLFSLSVLDAVRHLGLGVI